MSNSAPRPSPDRCVLHARLIRASAFSVASVLAVLLLTAALPPVVADQSDRAILDAPVTLLTSPISGEVGALNVAVGDRLDEGAAAVQVVNSRVDRTTLMDLQNKVSDAGQGLAAAISKRASDQRYVEALDRQIASQKGELVRQYELRTTDLQGQLAAAQALVSEKNALRDRQAKLVSQNVADPYMLKPTSQQLTSAQGMRESAAAKLAQNTSELDAIRQDVFVGDDLVGIAALSQKRRDVAFDAERQLIEETQARSRLQAASSLADAERQRIDRLSSVTLAAPRDADVLHVGVALGRHINAGDALVSLVDCRSLFAVAIFSYRQASNLSVGTRVSITMEGAPNPIDARVSEIIPKSSDATDALYAMPFPQTERREMYVLATPVAATDALRGRLSDGPAAEACPVGKWVTLTRQDGWMPSSSVVWHKATGMLVSMLRGVLAPAAANAHQRLGS